MRLNDCHSSAYNLPPQCRVTDIIAFFPSTSSPEPETNPGRPCASFEQKDGEDNAERYAEAGTDEHRGEAAIPL